MARLRRKVLWPVAMAAIFLISLAGAAAFLYRDEPPPADADLTTYRRVVPDGMNGFAAIDLSMEDVSFPDDENLLGVSELVPDYLEAVPLDPFDGKPLRWSAERKQVHSVGVDLIDSGGSAEEKSHTAVHDIHEPTLRIEASQ